MKKEIKNFDKVVEIILIVLTIISLVINALHITNAIYSSSYDVINLNNLLTNKIFTVLLWIDNILIYVFGLLNIVDAIKYGKNLAQRISFSLFSVFTTTIFTVFVVNTIAKIFEIF